MSYKTIVVHVDQSTHAPARIHQAARLANTYGAHLIGSAFTGISRYAAADVGMGLATMAPLDFDDLRHHTEQALARFDAIAAAEGVDSVEHRLLDDDAVGGLALQARYADLLVVSQTDPEEPASPRLIGGLPEQLVLDGGRPVLIVPYFYTAQHAAVGRKVLVAWDGSMEATHAVYNALPMLRRAALVSVAVLDRAAAAGRDPGTDLALYLARHGVSCEVRSETAPIAVGEELLSVAADLQTDLIVMGAYGHSRFREIMLGGVTETILGSMTAAVLMSH